MARARRKPLFPVALSPSAAADALGIRIKVIRDAITAGLLPAYRSDVRVRILVEDLVQWIKTEWRRT